MRVAIDRRGMPGGAGRSQAPARGARPAPGGPAQRHWDRDEWDMALDDGTICRSFSSATGGGWFMEGVHRLRQRHADSGSCHPSDRSRAIVYMSNSTLPPRSRFSTARRCPKRWSSAPRSSATRRWRCSIATASTARRAFTRGEAGRPGAIVGAELTVAVTQPQMRQAAPSGDARRRRPDQRPIARTRLSACRSSSPRARAIAICAG